MYGDPMSKDNHASKAKTSIQLMSALIRCGSAPVVVEGEFGRSDSCTSLFVSSGESSFGLAVRRSRKFPDFAGASFQGARAAFRTFELHQVPRPKIQGQKIQLHGLPHGNPRARDEAHGNARGVAASGSY
jgi:hypothetical protein